MMSASFLILSAIFVVVGTLFLYRMYKKGALRPPHEEQTKSQNSKSKPMSVPDYEWKASNSKSDDLNNQHRP